MAAIEFTRNIVNNFALIFVRKVLKNIKGKCSLTVIVCNNMYHQWCPCSQVTIGETHCYKRFGTFINGKLSLILMFDLRTHMFTRS